MKIRSLMTAVVFGLAAFSFNTSANTMTSELWVKVETSIRSLTVDGMERRIELLGQNASLGEQAIDDSVTQEQVRQIFVEYDTNAIKHLQFYQSNKEEIERWLTENQAEQEEYLRVKRRFDAVLEQFQAFQSPSNPGVDS